MINLLGFLLPALIDMFNRRIKDSDVRFWVSVFVCIFFGAFVVFVEMQAKAGLSLTVIVEMIAVKAMAMFGMAQLSYKKVWENSDLRDQLGLNSKTL